MRQKRHNKPELKNFRKDLRTTLTPAEAFYGNILKKDSLKEESSGSSIA